MLNVAIAIDAPIDYGPDAVRVVASACEEVIGENRCPVASKLPPGAVAAWFAVVHPSDRFLSNVRIEFRDRTADGVLIEERFLTFAASNSQESRLASVGSVIAALAAAREGTLTRPLHPERKAEHPATPVAPMAPPPTRTPPDWSVDLGAVVTLPLGGGPYRLGGLGRVRFAYFGRFFGLSTARYDAHSGDPSFTWSTLSAGIGMRVFERESRYNLELGGEVVFDYTRIATAHGADVVAQAGWGGRAAVGAIWAMSHCCSLVLSVDATLVLPRINVVVEGQGTTRLPSVTLAGALGPRFEF
jgi:hypothetical protein